MSGFERGDRVKIVQYAGGTDNDFTGVVGTVLGHGNTGEWVEVQPDRSPYPGWVDNILCQADELEAIQ